jgi:O-antigen/teichoic acid export membrane protein
MKKLSISFLSSIVIQLTNIASGILAARILQPHGRGELAVIFLWPTLLATIGQLGLADSVAYFASRKEYDPKRLYGTGIGLGAVFSMFLTALGIMLLPRVLRIQRAEVIHLACLYLCFIPLNFWILVNMSMFFGRGRLTLYNILRALVNVGYLAGILVIMALHRASLTGFTMASIEGNLLVLGFSFYWLMRHQWVGVRFDGHYALALLRYGMKVQLGSLTSLINLRVDQLFLSLFLSPTILGIYVVAMSMSGLVLLLPNTLAIVAFSDLANCENVEDRHQKFGRLVRLSMILASLGFVALRVLSPWALRAFFGPSYMPGLKTAWFLGLSMIFLSGNVVMSAGFKANGLPLVPSLAELCSFFGIVLALPFFLPRFGMLGVAFSTLLAYAASFTFNAYSLHRQLGLSWKSFLQPTRADWIYAQTRVKSLWKAIHP